MFVLINQKEQSSKFTRHFSAITSEIFSHINLDTTDFNKDEILSIQTLLHSKRISIKTKIDLANDLLKDTNYNLTYIKKQ